MSEADDLQRRVEAFADLSIRFIEGLPKTMIAQRMGGQYLDASTSVAANYRAARRGRSYDEFTAKLGLVSEEADETVYWLVRLKNAGIGGGVELPPLLAEAQELAKISVHRRGRREGVVDGNEIAKTNPQRVDSIDPLEMPSSDDEMPKSMLKSQIANRRCYLVPTVIQVHRFMPDALADILRKAPLNDEKMAFAWRAAVGAAMDRGTTVSLDRGVLRVQASGVAWRREVERSEALIRARLNALLGRGTIRAIEVAAESGSNQNR